MTLRRKSESIADKARKCLREKELGARHYKRSDALLAELIKEVEPGTSIQLNEHDAVIVKDNFADDIQYFHGSFARHYELKLVKA